MRRLPFYITTALFFAIGCSSEQDSNTHDSTAVIALADESKTPDTVLLLVPGKSAGNIRLNEDTEPIHRALGKPDAGDAAMQKAVAIWYKDHDPKSYATAIYSVRDTGDSPVARVKQIRSTSPLYRTSSGIGVSSALEDIQKEFIVKEVPDYTGEKGVKIYDSKDGVAFEIGTDLKCQAILVHPAGEEIKATYLPLR
ncbi:MAG: hypothetical protein V4594_14380 [Bacteroidota bacterium]